jgi:hypothetical protein
MENNKKNLNPKKMKRSASDETVNKERDNQNNRDA